MRQGLDKYSHRNGTVIKHKKDDFRVPELRFPNFRIRDFEPQEYSDEKISGKIHEQERDVAKVIECDGVKVMYVGIENQTDIDVDETKRVIGYDGAVYRGQV